ncbi:hypothetical protein BAE44_0000698 [Dichanthelium oligosanthes]|uniref:Xylanase inhibitor C-terminal domain-containing protein n=1 Tax=Dichanthelium oligosanthes TaxID=888268 RepID=A0A1E5WLP1_9POAL|nr:hypothetical protein BAE44_0000698 [Dichanthelium oligosanthes]
MTQYTRAKPLRILDTCFDFGNQTTVSVPTVELVFDGGAVVDLDFDGIIILGSCLAFAANDADSSAGIIGNVQQRTFEVLYDVGHLFLGIKNRVSTMGFRGGAC